MESGRAGVVDLMGCLAWALVAFLSWFLEDSHEFPPYMLLFRAAFFCFSSFGHVLLFLGLSISSEALDMRLRLFFGVSTKRVSPFRDGLLEYRCFPCSPLTTALQ